MTDEPVTRHAPLLTPDQERALAALPAELIRFKEWAEARNWTSTRIDQARRSGEADMWALGHRQGQTDTLDAIFNLATAYDLAAMEAAELHGAPASTQYLLMASGIRNAVVTVRSHQPLPIDPPITDRSS